MEHEQNSEERAAYGQQTLRALSKELTKEFGRGFSVSNIQFMRRFHHSNSDKRSFYEKEAINSGWSVREMKRQIATPLYERLLLSDGKANKGASKKLVCGGAAFLPPQPFEKLEIHTGFRGFPNFEAKILTACSCRVFRGSRLLENGEIHPVFPNFSNFSAAKHLTAWFC